MQTASKNEMAVAAVTTSRWCVEARLHDISSLLMWLWVSCWGNMVSKTSSVQWKETSQTISLREEENFVLKCIKNKDSTFIALFCLDHLKIEHQYLADGETEVQKGKMRCPKVAGEVTNRALSPFLTSFRRKSRGKDVT